MANPLIAVMQRYKTPRTREEFLKLKYAGKPPASVGPEDEEDTPVRFQKAFPTHEETKAEEDKKAEGKTVAAKPKPVPPPVYTPSKPAVQANDIVLGAKQFPNPKNVQPVEFGSEDGLYMPDVDPNAPKGNPGVGNFPLIPADSDTQ